MWKCIKVVVFAPQDHYLPKIKTKLLQILVESFFLIGRSSADMEN